MNGFASLHVRRMLPRLQALVDEALMPEAKAELESHLAACSACRRARDTFHRTQSLLILHRPDTALLSAPRADALLARVFAASELEAALPPMAAPSRARMRFALAVVGSMVLLAAGGGQLTRLLRSSEPMTATIKPPSITSLIELPRSAPFHASEMLADLLPTFPTVAGYAALPSAHDAPARVTARSHRRYRARRLHFRALHHRRHGWTPHILMMARFEVPSEATLFRPRHPSSCVVTMISPEPPPWKLTVTHVAEDAPETGYARVSVFAPDTQGGGVLRSCQVTENTDGTHDTQCSLTTVSPTGPTTHLTVQVASAAGVPSLSSLASPVDAAVTHTTKETQP